MARMPVDDARQAASKVGILDLKAGLSIDRVLLRPPQLAKRVSDLTDALVAETDRERLELVLTIGTWKMLSDLIRSLEVPLEEGAQPWPPDGSRPEARTP